MFAASVLLQSADKLEHVATEHFWMSGMYWGLTAMALMGKLDQMDTAKILDWVRGCSLSSNEQKQAVAHAWQRSAAQPSRSAGEQQASTGAPFILPCQHASRATCKQHVQQTASGGKRCPAQSAAPYLQPG